MIFKLASWFLYDLEIAIVFLVLGFTIGEIEIGFLVLV